MNRPLAQFNITFSPVEDRLLFRLSTPASADGAVSEFRLWLTRRLVKMLLPILDKMAETDGRLVTQVPEGDRKTVMEFQQQAALSKADFKTPYSQETKETPLGEAPLLISRIQAGKDRNGRQILILKTLENKGINIGLNPQMIHSMKMLIFQGVKKAQWAIDAAPPEPEMVPRPDKLI